MTSEAGIAAVINATTLEAQNSTAGNISITTLSTIRVVGNGVTNTFDGGSVSITSSGDLFLDASVTSENGLLQLAAEKGGKLTIANPIDSGDGQLELTASSDIEISAAITTAGDLLMGSQSGGIITQEPTNVVSANLLDLSASEGIKIFTSASSLEAENTGQGGVVISELDTLEIAGDGVTNAETGDVLITTSGGLINRLRSNCSRWNGIDFSEFNN